METLVHRLLLPVISSVLIAFGLCLCVCECVCVLIYLPKEQRENSYVTKAGALWFGVLREASALTSVTLISFSHFPWESFPFSIR